MAMGPMTSPCDRQSWSFGDKCAPELELGRERVEGSADAKPGLRPWMSACERTRRLYSASMGIEQLKAELRAASPEMQEELFTLLGVLRRSGDPARQQRLAEKLDSPTGWVSEEDAARRLGLPNENR